MENKVSIVIPAYNEEKSISKVIDEILSVMDKENFNYEIIVVDDGSNDMTFDILQKKDVTVFRHSTNKGYGAALKTGIINSTNNIILITDADCTYPESDIPVILKELDNADMVVGSRINSYFNISLCRRLAKWILKLLAQYITEEKISDLNSGMRAFRRDVFYRYINILPDKFSFTTTITVAMLMDKYEIKYLPINYRIRVGKSKIIPWDFFSFITLILRLSVYFNPLRIFLPFSMILIFLSFVKLISDIYLAMNKYGLSLISLYSNPMVSISSMILFVSGVQILLIGMIADSISRSFRKYGNVKK